MPISSISQVFRSDPYTLPMSQELLGKVLSIKQAKFDEAAKNIQSGVNKLGALDILHPTKKAYANEKVNGLVNSINDLGGVDLGDANISNQIESMGSDIYNDPNIIEGLSSTSAIRSLQSFYAKAKTDPKLNKLYAPQNEEHDMDPVNNYLSNKNLDAQYSGGSTPTPYVPFKDDLIKNIQGVKANLTQSWDSNGNLILVNNEHKEVSPERIVQMARDLTTPEQQNQMNIDADYNGKRTSPNDIVSRAWDVHNSKITSAVATLARYQDMYNNSSNDPLAHQKYEAMVKDQQGQVDQLTSVKPEDFVAKFKADPKNFNRGLYADEMYRGLGEKFAYQEDNKKLVPNFATMFNLKMDQAERFHQDEMQFKAAELAQKGLKKDANGNIIRDNSTNFTLSPPSTDNPNDQVTGEEGLTGRIDELSNNNTNILQKYLSKFANANPEVRDLMESTQTGSGIAIRLKGQQLLEDVNGQAGLQIQDLNIDPESTQYKTLIKGGLTPKQLEVYKNIYNAYDQAATGQDHGISKFPDGTEALVEKLSLNNEAIDDYKSKIKGINSTIASQIGVSADDLNLLTNFKSYIDRDKKFRNTFYSSLGNLTGNSGMMSDLFQKIQDFFGDGPRAELTPEEQKLFSDPNKILSIMKTLNTPEYKTAQKQYYNQIENRPVYARPILGNGYFGNQTQEDVQILAAGILKDKGDIKGNQMDVSSKDIELIDAGRGYGANPYTLRVRVKLPDGKTFATTSLSLDPSQYKQFGFQEGPYDILNEAVTMRGESLPKLISASLNRNIQGRIAPLRAKIVVVKDDPEDRNDLTSTAYLLDDQGKRVTVIPKTKLQTPAEAYAAAKAFVQNSENAGYTYEQMIERAKKDSY